MYTIPPVVGLALAALALIAPAALAVPGDGYIWEYTSTMEMQGMKMPMPVMQRCQAAARPENIPPMQGSCTVSKVQTSGDTTTFEMSCPAPNEMNGSGSSTITETTQDSAWTFRSAEGEMTMTMRGERKGPCDTSAPQPAMKGMPGMAAPR